jgi:hypothetical protein
VLNDYQHVVTVPDSVGEKRFLVEWEDVSHADFALLVSEREAKLGIPAYSDRLVATWQQGEVTVEVTGPKYDKKLLDPRNVEALQELSQRLAVAGRDEAETTEFSAVAN